MAVNYPWNQYYPYPYGNTQQPQQTQPQQQTPARSLMTIPSEMDAQNYPVAPGNSVLFQDLNHPDMFYEKSMGFSSLDRPMFKRFRLVEEVTETSQQAEEPQQYVTKAEYNDLKKMVDTLRASISLFADKEKIDV